jgi:ABC-2 type transport system ATP-binding protein
VIEVHALTQRYGSYEAVADVSFSLAAGEVVGFLGPNGAGKTTTLKVIASYLAPSAGRVVVGGSDVASDPIGVRKCLGYLAERCPLYDEMLVSEFLEWAGQVRELSRPERRLARDRVVERCRLEEVVGRPISDLSKGYRQRVGLAQALLHEPRILVLDEPTSGLDPNQVVEMRALVRELGEERTVLFSSHVLSEVEATCERVVVIHQGRLVADDRVAALARRITGGAVDLRAEGASDLAPRLAGLEGVARCEPLPTGWRVHPSPGVDDLAARLFRWARAEDVVLVELAPRRVALEDVFTSLTANPHSSESPESEGGSS